MLQAIGVGALPVVVLGLEVADDHAGLEQGVPVVAVEAFPCVAGC
jgi:hypothetical protein